MTDGLRLENATILIDGVRLLDDVSLQLAPRGRRAIQGPSGSGKSRLLRAIVALDRCQGTLTLDGEPPDVIGYPAWRSKVVWVHQRANLHP